MDTIIIKDICEDTYTNRSGFVLFTQVEKYVSKGQTVSLSFKGISGLSSSFLNSSIGALVENYGRSILQFIRPISLTKVQAHILKDYVASLREVA